MGIEQTSITHGNRLAWTIRLPGFFTHGDRRRLRSRPLVGGLILSDHRAELLREERWEWRKERGYPSKDFGSQGLGPEERTTSK